MSFALDAAPGAFLVISTVALTAQTVTLIRIRRNKTAGDVRRRGLVRTVACRVFAAALYVLLGTGALLVTPAVAGVAAFLCFGFTQCLWLGSSLLDLRLKHQLSPNEPTGRHREETHH